MNRRQLLLTAGALGFLTAIRVKGAVPQIVLRGGRCFREGQWRNEDVGIDEQGRLLFGEAGSLEGSSIISVTNQVISAGFIDILADNAANPVRTYKIFERYKLADGVTTALQMHGGSGDIKSYYRTFDAMPHLINYGVSTAVMRIRYATSSLRERAKRVEQCLEEGGLGVSHSIEYQPTPFEEVLTYAKLAKKYDRTFFLHLRYSSSEDELTGVDEAIRLARESGVRLHIDHLHSTGGTFHMAEALSKIRQARSEGIPITCCVYPYSYWATYLHSTRFGPGWQKRYGITYHDLRLVGTGERLTPDTFRKYKEQKKLVAVPDGTLPLETTVDLALREEFCMIGSDGGIEYASHANSHPRGAGCFATALWHAGKMGLPLEKMLGKMTTLPRSLVAGAMKDRGELRQGAIADLTVFDPEQIAGRATVENPNQFSEGISFVFVNGKAAFERSGVTGTNGMPVKFA